MTPTRSASMPSKPESATRWSSPARSATQTLRTLYRRCAAFAFPSLYEGFGLPLLEAMLCGAAVVAGNNSSQPEVVGDAGLLANVADPTDLAAKLAQLLQDPALAATLRTRALVRARQFRWEQTAERALAVLAGLAERRPAARCRGDRGPRAGRGSPSSRRCRRGSRASRITRPRCLAN